MSNYWSGTFVCHRKALSHISGQKCLSMWDQTKCASCANHVEVQMQIERDENEEEERKRECKLISLRSLRKR